MKVPLVAGFLALLALIGLDYFLTNRTVAQLQQGQQRINELQAARLELEAVLRAYVDAETGQRGFLLTHDDSFLSVYKSARERLASQRGALKAMLGADAELSAIRSQIDEIGERALMELEAGIALGRAGDATAAAESVRAAHAVGAMERARQQADEIDRRKSAEIDHVLQQTKRARWLAAVRTSLSSGVLASALVALYLFARMHLREREQAREAAAKALAAELAAHSEAAHANKLKDEFLALVSHELRTPLNAMLGWTSLLKEGAADERELKEGLETIDRNARAQARLVDDLLDVSRIISGKVRLQISEVNLRAVIASVIEALRPAAQARGVDVQFHATSEPADVLGDVDRLQQVVWNLLSNAIKFTPRGGNVRVGLEVRDSTVAFEVTDTGPGIRAEFLPHVFERFTQGDPSTTRGHGGLGLGLAITRHLVELHGGHVSATSPGEGLGATFRVAIPVVAVKELKHQLAQRMPGGSASASQPEEEIGRMLDGKRVLVVDDQPDTLSVVRRVLTRHGAEVRTADGVQAGLVILADWPPDVLISDIGMPGHDGFSFIRAVRALGKSPVSRVPAMALTAFARESDRKAAIDAGFDEHLAKPIDAGTLVRKVAGMLTR